MSRLAKKSLSVTLALTTAVWLSGLWMVPSVSAQTDLSAFVELLISLGIIPADKVAAARQAVTQPAAPAPGAFTYQWTRFLGQGDRGDDVAKLQEALDKAGHYGYTGTPKYTSFYGSLTAAAVRAYQAANGISQVGTMGPRTMASLNTRFAAGAPAAPGVTPPPPGVVVPATGLALSLASDTPAAAAIPKSAANVPYMKFNVAGKGKLNAVTVKRVGAGATGDFDNVYLYEGARRLTSGRSLNSTTHEASFVGVNLSVDGVKTLTVSADVASGVGAGNKNGFSIVKAEADVTVTGVPITGNEMTQSSAAAGTVTVEKAGSLSNPNVGQADAQLSEFRVTTATEDGKLSRVALFHGGTVSKSNLSNFKLKDTAGTVLATAAGINEKDQAVFELASPFTIARGENKLFRVYGDIGSNAKKDETVKLYVEENSDVLVVGAQYGYGMGVTKTSFDSTAADHHVLTLQGAKFTISFLGPNVADVARRAKDVTLFEFTLSSVNNIEVRKLNASITLTSIAGDDEKLLDVKIVDTATGLTVAGPADVASGTDNAAGKTFTDIFIVEPNKARRLKITADIPSTWDDGDKVQVDLAAFTADQDLKNLDNNTFLAAAEMSPSTKISGNAQTIKIPTLTLNRAGLPVTDSFVKGKKAVPLIGFSLSATTADIKVTTIKVTSTSASVTDDDQIADLVGMGLYDGNTLVGTIKSLTSDSASTAIATFDNLNFVVPKGATKVLVAKADLSSAAVTNNAYEVGLVAATTTNNSTGKDIVAVDPDGNEPFYAGAGAINVDSAVKITVLSAGKMLISRAPDDAASKAGIVVAGRTGVILSKFNLTAQNEDLTIKKLKLLVNNDSATGAAATSTDEVLKVYLYDGNTQIGATGGYIPIGSGSTAGDVTIEDLSWVIGKDVTKTLVIKVDLTLLTQGGDSGQELYAQVRANGFEAAGASANVNGFDNQGGAIGRVKAYYKTHPTVTALALDSTTLTGATDLQIAKFKIKAESEEDIAWAAIGLRMNLVNASFSDVALSIRDITNGLDLTVSTQANSVGSTDLTGDATRHAIIQLSSPETIAKGVERSYEVKLNATAAQFGTANELEVLTVALILYNDSAASNILNATTFSRASNSSTPASGTDKTIDGDSAFIWTDFALAGTEDADEDWANGVYVDTFPSSPVWERKR